MCGIVGVIDKTGKPVDEQELIRARDIVRHRGPDGEGCWLHQNIGFGHRRLSIIGRSGKGNQPLKYRHIVVIHNGEIYNYLELRAELIRQGYSFQTETDTEVLAAAYCHWGQDCVHQFNGMWSFAIYDLQKNQVFCSRDRFGIKPLYYCNIGGKFCFASEIKQFTAIAGWKAAMNKTRCHAWLINASHDQTEETLFDGVLQLQAGHNLIFDIGSNHYKITRYYDLRQQVSIGSNLSFEDAKHQFRDLLYDSVRLQLRSDVKIGLTLSGGIDSSALAAVMVEALSNSNTLTKLESFSACFHEPGYDEEPFIDAAVQKNGLLSHKIFPSFPELLAQWRKVTWHMDEPLLTPSDITHYLVFEKAKEHGVKVNLCGQGADEILAGYDAFYQPFWKSLMFERPLQAILEIGGFLYYHPATVKKKIQRFWGQNLGSNLKLPPNLRSEWLVEASSLPLLPPRKTMLESSIQFIEATVLPYILHSEDRLSMAHSVESRVPFLDHRVVAFCLMLKDEYKIQGGKRKRLLRVAMKPQIPETVYRRYDKIGFETPLIKPSIVQLEQVLLDLGKHKKPAFLGRLGKMPGVSSWRQAAFLQWYRLYFDN